MRQKGFPNLKSRLYLTAFVCKDGPSADLPYMLIERFGFHIQC